MGSLPLTTHVFGESYQSRYTLHPFSGYELAQMAACPSFSFGGSRTRCEWLGGGDRSDLPGPGEVCFHTFMCVYNIGLNHQTLVHVVNMCAYTAKVQIGSMRIYVFHLFDKLLSEASPVPLGSTTSKVSADVRGSGPVVCSAKMHRGPRHCLKRRCVEGTPLP